MCLNSVSEWSYLYPSSFPLSIEIPFISYPPSLPPALHTSSPMNYLPPIFFLILLHLYLLPHTFSLFQIKPHSYINFQGDEGYSTGDLKDLWRRQKEIQQQMYLAGETCSSHETGGMKATSVWMLVTKPSWLKVLQPSKHRITLEGKHEWVPLETCIFFTDVFRIYRCKCLLI